MTEFSEPSDAKKFVLDDYEEHWQKYLALKPLAKEYEKYHKRFKELFGDADEIVYKGVVVATNKVSGKFQPSQLQTDRPNVHKAFLKMVVKEEFDEEAFKTAHPDLWEQYRSRSVLISKEK